MQEIRNASKQDADQKKISLFYDILRDSDLPEFERSEARLAKEAQTLLGAGTASTSRTIGFASYYILSHPDTIRKKLEEELEETMKQWPSRVPTWAELERLPYLQAIIKESLRYVAPLLSIFEKSTDAASMHSFVWTDRQNVFQAQLRRDAATTTGLPGSTDSIQTIHNTAWSKWIFTQIMG